MTKVIISMKISCKLIIFHLISLHFLCMPIISKAKSCYGTKITCPFWLKDGGPMPKVSSPSFGLYCDDELMKPLLELPNAGNFIVDYISSYSREITLLDPNNCLPQKLLLLDFNTISPFHLPATTNMKDFDLYNCSGVFDNQFLYLNEEIDCLKGSNYTIISQESDFSYVDSSCTFLKKLSVPSDYMFSFNSLSYVSSIDLIWDVQNCELNDGNTSPSKIYLLPVLLGGLPIVSLLLICAYCKWKTRNQTGSSSHEAPIVGVATASNTTRGLDATTINSYPMVVIGGSRRLIHPDDTTCSICLSDYSPGETLKILPECVHRFHVDCIDQWLLAKASCPICRTSPPLNS